MLAVEMLDEVETHHGFVHRHLDKTALARALALKQRSQNRVRSHQPTGLVGGDGRQIARFADLPVHQVGQTAHALNHIVVSGHARVWTGLAKTMHAHVDEPRKLRAQRVLVEPEFRELLRAHAVHEHVGGGDQRLQRFLRIRLLEIEHHALLAAIAAEKHRRHALFHGGAGMARGIARGRFYLDDLGPVVSQHLAAHRAEDHAGKVEHAHPCQGALVRQRGLHLHCLLNLIVRVVRPMFDTFLVIVQFDLA